MAHASVRGFRRGLALGFGMLVAAGVGLAMIPEGLASARDPEKPSTAKPADKGKPSDPARHDESPKHDEHATPSGSGVKDKQDLEVIKIIDDKLEEAWKKNKVTPSDRCTDYEFIRRASLDLIGRIATPGEVRQYMAEPSATRRARLVERLLSTDQFADNWANIWSNWLLTRAGPFGRGKHHEEMKRFVQEQFAVGKVVYSEMVTKLITAKGKTSDDNGAPNFILAHLGEPIRGKPDEGAFDMVPVTSRLTRLFLGIQTQCTQCHDHPFDQRQQKEFWGINAFLRQVRRDGGGNRDNQMAQADLILHDDPNLNKDGFVFYEKRNGVVLQTQPAFFNEPPLKVGPGVDRRKELAKYLIDHENFSKSLVNRMWAHFFGKGFVNPIDDFNSQNTVNHPELLDALGEKFKSYGYDVKQLMRWICNSRAYNLKCVTNATNDKPEQDILFSRMLLKSMSPEQLFQSLWTATEAEIADGPLPAREDKAAEEKRREAKRNKENAWMSGLVANFGDDEGNEITFNGTVVQALLLMNGKEINETLSAKNSVVNRMVMRNGVTAYHKNITDLYLHAYNRPPTEAEVQKVLKALPLVDPRHDRPYAPWQDLFWALLNSNEFLLNH